VSGAFATFFIISNFKVGIFLEINVFNQRLRELIITEEEEEEEEGNEVEL